MYLKKPHEQSQWLASPAGERELWWGSFQVVARPDSLETGFSLNSRASEVELLPSSLSGLGEAFLGPESFLPEEGACCLPQA